MRVAVVSDIHGNLHALEAVLADIVREEADEVWCLGDVVGYGPHPNECCALVRKHAVFSLCGNHDLAVVGGIDLSDFSGDAAVAARWTRDVLEPGHAGWLRSLTASGTRSGVEAYHGSPRDPVWDYVLSDEIALASLASTTAPLVLVGHSHVALGVWLDGDHLDGGQADDSTEIELVGATRAAQPRIGGPAPRRRSAGRLALARSGGRDGGVPADGVRRGRRPARLRAAGLPELLAERLAHGI